MAIEVFNRYETKYLLSAEDYVRVRSAIAPYMELDPYNVSGACYTISNIYYDTRDSALIRHSLSKPVYKEKLRLRAYGVPHLDDCVYLEIKKKVRGLVNKRRSSFYLEDAYSFLNTQYPPVFQNFMNAQVVKEITYFIRHYVLEPKVYIAYDRIAYFGKENPDLRISFDTNVRTRRNDLGLELGDHGSPLLAQDIWLMEIKAEKTLPIWVCQMLSKYQLHKTSFSKYGTEYQNYVAAQAKGAEKTCLTSCSITQPIPHLQLTPQF